MRGVDKGLLLAILGAQLSRVNAIACKGGFLLALATSSIPMTKPFKFPAKSALMKLLAFAVTVNLFPTFVAYGDLETTTLENLEAFIGTTSLVAEPTLFRSTRRIRATVTAYSSTADQTDDTPCITASGLNICSSPNRKIIAANFLPFGTKVKIPELFGNEIFTVEDRMNKRYNGHNRLDVWMVSRTNAKRFGVNSDVEVVVY